MDQAKIGKFIQAERKRRGLTQSRLAEKLAISDKTVSKWETGNGLPEVSLMLPLCEVLQISVNELLSGERLDGKQYQIEAEKNIMRLMKEKEESKRKIFVCVLVAATTLVAGITLVLVAGLTEMRTQMRAILLAIAVGVIVSGIVAACILGRDAGYYECPYCGERFVPTMKEYVCGRHTLTRRRLKCPRCGRKGSCKKRLNGADGADKKD